MQLDCSFSLTQAKAHHVIIKVRANVHRQEYVSCDEAVFIHSKEPCIEIRGNLHHAHHRSNTARSQYHNYYNYCFITALSTVSSSRLGPVNALYPQIYIVGL